MRIARARYDGKRTTVIVQDDWAQLVRGGPFGRLNPTGERIPLSEIQLLAPVRPTKIVAIGVNYHTHVGDRTVPSEPQPFLKAPSSLIGPGEPILLPKDAGRIDEEAEIVAVIGRRARNLDEHQVDRHILGYTCGNDVSARDWQRDDLQWWRAKSSDTFTSVGPWIETDMDPERIHLEGYVNGKCVQEADTSMLIHSIRKCVAHVSQAMTLERGDLIFTGTPGVTEQLHAGDVVEVKIEGIGSLTNPVSEAS